MVSSQSSIGFAPNLPIIDSDYIQALRQKRVTAIAMEYLQADDGTLPLVRIMSEIAGISSRANCCRIIKSSEARKGTLG
ncbi:MAG: hypothetical protein IPG95_07650 [Saprospiraceae bacterium]|nr:hypothetical protein [Saprospiraceae bacterium]